MKLLNGQIVFEEATCRSCDGRGKHKEHPLCPNNNKVVGAGKKCPICGAKNKYSHRAITTIEQIVPCNICNGTGKVMENKFSNLPNEIFRQIPMEIGRDKKPRSPLEKLLGIGIVGGATDYGRLREFYAANGDTATIQKVRSEDGKIGRQVLNFLNARGELATKLILVIREFDYSVYAEW